MTIFKRILLTTLGFVASGPSISFAQSDLLDQARALFKPIPEIAQARSGEATTPDMVELGKALYFDPRLSESHNISCNTCHQIGLGFDHRIKQAQIRSFRRLVFLVQTANGIVSQLL